MTAAPSPVTCPSRGEIWLVRFDPQRGAEIGKTRPAVVLSLDSIGILPLRVVVPLTEWNPRYASVPWMLNVKPNGTNGLSKESAADAFQVKSLSLDRFERRLGRLPVTELGELAQLVAFCVGA